MFSGWWCNNHLEKYEFVNGKDDIPYFMEKNMFETTNQFFVPTCPILMINSLIPVDQSPVIVG